MLPRVASSDQYCVEQVPDARAGDCGSDGCGALHRAVRQQPDGVKPNGVRDCSSLRREHQRRRLVDGRSTAPCSASTQHYR